MTDLELVDQLVGKRMEEMLERMSRMMDKKLDKVYEELRAVGERVESEPEEEEKPPSPEEQSEDTDEEDDADEEDIYSLDNFSKETVWATMEDLKKESFWTDDIRGRLWVALFHDPANQKIMLPGLWDVLRMAVPFQQFVRALLDQQREEALSDPSLSAAEKEVFRNPPHGNFFGVIDEVLKMAAIAKTDKFDAEAKLKAAKVFRLGNIELVDNELTE